MNELERDAVSRHNLAQIEYFERAGKHAMRPADSHYVRRQVDRLVAFADLVAGERVLDVGCGMGRYTFTLADRGVTVEGIDLSETLLERFRDFAGKRYAIPLHRGDILDPPDDVLGGRFDAIVGFFTLHHLHDLRGSVCAMRALAKPGGRIVFLEPNPLNPLYYVQMLVVPGMSWSGERGLLNMRRRTVFDAFRAAGLVAPAFERFGFLPPFAVNRSWGPRLEDRLERVRLWQRLLPFQLFRAEVPG